MRKLWMLMATLSVGSLLSGGAIATSAEAATGTAFGGRPIVTASGTPSTGLPTIAYNWSGYAATTTAAKPFNYVSSTWVQPTVTCTGKQYENTSNWVGLDGFTSDTVEQDGTAVTCGGPTHTTARYYAWYEMYPKGEVDVFPVSAGDTISASVAYASGVFTLNVQDVTAGRSITDTATCASCQRSSAEWIIERPADCTNSSLTDCFITPLADFGTTKMSQDFASNGAAKKPVGDFTNYQTIMVTPLKKGFISLVGVSPLNAAGGSFSVTFERTGSQVPISL